jgi:hypothetical protein
MMTDEIDQTQKVAANAIAVQAGRDVHVGLSYSDARDIARDVFKAGFLELRGEAAAVAQARADEIIERFLDELQKKNPAGVEQAANVDFQHALFGMQRDYARSGDADLGDMLVKLLIERSKSTSRDLMHLVLNESLATAPKLTSEQLSILGVIFFLRYTRSLQVNNLDTLLAHFDETLLPLISDLRATPASLAYLSFAGCATETMMAASIPHIFRATYPALFNKGFEETERPKEGTEGFMRMIMRCIRDTSRYQVNAMDKATLDQQIQVRGIGDVEAATLRKLFAENEMSDDEITADLNARRDYFGPLLAAWSEHNMSHFQLTAVGQAIGHASICRFNEKFGPLSVWIN